MKFRTASQKLVTAVVVVLLANLALAFFIPSGLHEQPVPDLKGEIPQQVPLARPEYSKGIRPGWINADPHQSWSELKIPEQPRSHKPSRQPKTKVQAYFKFAAAKGVKLDAIPEELLLSIAEDPLGDMVMAIMYVESAFQPNNKTANNYGLMQIADVHFKEYARARPYITQCGVRTKKDLFDPQKNVCVGMSYFTELLEEHSMNRRKALMAYNASYRKQAYAVKVDKAYREIVAYKTHSM